jgi:cytoplasmic iron level regulating protein YaaA (DUF328/UPF0246 family)
MKLILSPAKLMRAHQVPAHGKPVLLIEAKFLMQQLKAWSVHDLSKHMKLSEVKAQETHQLLQNWGSKKNLVQASPALFAYIGEAFKALDAALCSQEELAYLQNNLFILSGVYGLLKPLDQIEMYRLEMAQRGVAPDGQSLYEFWRVKVEKQLLKALAKDEYILNLASSEYSDLIQEPKLRSRMVTPHFFEEKSGQLKAVSVFSKQARGTMAKWCATNELCEPKAIQAFTELGYRFAAEKSSENDWMFIR